MNGHRIGVAAVVVMLALSGGMAASAISSPSTADSTVAQTADTQTALQELNASVTFDDQTTSNTTVTVQNVTLAEGGYVAVHDSSVLDGANASVGTESVVGVSDYLEAGTHENVTVTLYGDVPGAEFDNATVNDTETLVAVLHTETSDDAPPATPGNNTTDDNATTTPTTTPDNTTGENTTDTPTTPDNTTTDNTTTAPTTPDNTTDGNATEPTTTPNAGANNTTDDNTTDGNATGDAVTGMAAVTQQNATNTFDFVTSGGEADGPSLVDGEPVTDAAEVTFEADETAPDEAGEAPTDDDTESATGDLVVEDLDAPAYVTPGSTVTVNATVTNEAAEDREEDVAFRLEGGDVDVVRHQTVAVEANETTTVTFEVNTTDVPVGSYIHGVTTENSSEFDEIAVTNESAVDVEDQNLTNETLTVDSVFVPEGGYVAIHDGSVLDSANASVGTESVVGVSDYLEAGYHENVTVTLYDDVPGAEFDNATVNDTTTLAAVPHLETNATDNATNTFDFVTSDGEADGPSLADGELVVDAATVTADAETNATA